MNEQAVKASYAIEAVKRALANWTVQSHGKLSPDLFQRYGADWEKEWAADVESRLMILAQAVAVNRPALFSHFVQWSSGAFSARSGKPEDLVDSTRCLGEVVQRHLPDPIANVAHACVDHALQAISQADPPPPSKTDDYGVHGRRVARYLEALLEGDRTAAGTLVLTAVDDGLSVPDIYEHILAPGQIELGRMWHAGEITAADEHVGSATTQMAMSLLRPNFPKAQNTGRVVVAASVAGDLHEIGVRMVADFFEMNGWRAVYAGANTPNADLLAIVRERRPDVLAISASTALHVRTVGELIALVRAKEDAHTTRIIAGGLPFTVVPDLWEEVGADGCASSARGAVELANRLRQSA